MGIGLVWLSVWLVWLIVELLSIYNNGNPDIDNIECVCAAVRLYDKHSWGGYFWKALLGRIGNMFNR
jgi:hypothetical protein